MKTSFSIFLENKLNPQVTALILDKSILRFKTLSLYLSKNGFVCNVEEYQKLKLYIQHSLTQQIEAYAIAFYLNCSKTGEWGENGENACKISLCRLFLNIDCKKLISTQDLIEFERLLTDKLNFHAIHSDNLSNFLKNFEVNILGKCFKPGHVEQIQSILNFFETHLYFYAGIEQSYYSLLLGKGTKNLIEEHIVYDIDYEIIRTPNLTTTMAAVIIDRSIYIRKSAIKTIFFQKWELKNNIHTLNEWEIAANAIKEKTLSLYETELEGFESLFLADMRETILKHEIGHGIVQHEILPIEIASLGEATKFFGETIYSSILEFMADFCPSSEKSYGPIFNMIEISKTDYIRAQRMYWMYLSDVWFYNTQDTFMYSYSDLMCLVLLHFIESDGKIRFDKLEKSIFFRKPKETNKAKGIYEQLYQLFTNDSEHLMAIAKSAQYQLSTETLNYEQVKTFLIGHLKKHNPHLSEFSYTFKTLFWFNIFCYVDKFSDKKKQIYAFIENQKIVLINQMLCFVSGKQKAEKIGYNQRSFILDQAKRCGLLKNKTNSV